MAGRLEGKVAIITGGTSGIGKASVEAFVREGAKVVFSARRDAGFEQEKALKEQGYDVTFVQADLSKVEDCRKVVPACVEKYGTVDILVNNAGTAGTLTPVIYGDLAADWDKVFDLNIRAYYLLTQDALKVMVPAGGGNIINVASIGGHTALPFGAAYSAAKGGVLQLTRTVAIEYAGLNIRCNSMSPGLTMTEMVADVDGDMLTAIVPAHKAGTAEGAANCILYLATDESPFLTGQDIAVDGGVTCGRCPEPPADFLHELLS
jgi:NAD(P)-dependent dehydrogenase (short-subunit alcohol dehydrogenase family)